MSVHSFLPTPPPAPPPPHYPHQLQFCNHNNLHTAIMLYHCLTRQTDTQTDRGLVADSTGSALAPSQLHSLLPIANKRQGRHYSPRPPLSLPCPAAILPLAGHRSHLTRRQHNPHNPHTAPTACATTDNTSSCRTTGRPRVFIFRTHTSTTTASLTHMAVTASLTWQ